MPSWTFAQIKMLLRSLNDAKLRNEHLDDASLDELFQGLCEPFKQRWAHRQWNRERFWGKYRHLRQVWAAFRTALRGKGHIGVRKDGTITMTPEAENLISKKYGPDMVNCLLNKGLMLNRSLKLQSWRRIFGKTGGGYGPPYGKAATSWSCCSTPTTPAFDVINWLEHDDGPEYESTDDAVEVINTEDASGDDCEAHGVQAIHTESASDHESQAQQGKTSQTQPPGTSHLEKAVKDVARFSLEHGMHHLVDFVSWLRLDSTNPIIWNALESDECKLEWVKTALHGKEQGWFYRELIYPVVY
ncbi:hypothetical protein CDD82_7071 [Ophiocordyceps australis]|uniref:Myb/SANT-like domain-containing protein n=1 Tax=Ophiocordyceps australis TaxID=1399860 RepID=A0A2C5ZPZ6_9HYPO|nr:hypothetical protein CDD82_7071 [Ophiocordyceps australis]